MKYALVQSDKSVGVSFCALSSENIKHWSNKMLLETWDKCVSPSFV